MGTGFAPHLLISWAGRLLLGIHQLIISLYTTGLPLQDRVLIQMLYNSDSCVIISTKMQGKGLKGFKIQKTPVSLGYLATTCGVHWKYSQEPGAVPSYRCVTLEPYRIKEEYFNVVKEAQLYWTKLLVKLSFDVDIVEKLHDNTNDLTIKAFLKIARKVSENTKKVVNFFITRCDYIFNESKQVFQQTEFNAMSVGMWTVADPAQQFHLLLQPLREKPSNIYLEPTKIKIISAFEQVHDMYCEEYKVPKKEAGVLIIAVGMDSDAMEQAEIQKCLLLKNIMVTKATFTSLATTDRFSYSSQTGLIKVDGIQISIVYYRQGYKPEHYEAEGSMLIREKLELSRAVCVPNICIQLLNFKNVQVQLKTTDIIKQYLPANEAQRLLEVQTAIFTTDQINKNKEQIIKQYGNNLAVKSIHQGSQELYFKEKAVQKLGVVDLNSFMVMEYIASGVRPVQMLMQKDTVVERDCITEMGTFGIGLFKSPQEVIRNEYVGYLCRTFQEATLNLGSKAVDVLEFI